MTTAIFPSRRTRLAAVTAGLAAALALAGCGGGGDGGSDDRPTGPSASPNPSASGTGGTERAGGAGGGSGDSSGSGSGGASGGGSSGGGELSGSWLTTAGGKAVVLMVNGTQAGLFATGGTMCSGTATGKSGTRTIRLACTDGSKDRAVGTVDSVRGRTLQVTWQGGLGKETYTKSEGGKLPTGLPTASLGAGS
ncbi:hypothetical protein AB0912_21275 [Streptomyces sp. NPDC007084]|uniref:hypothetical protein n=1 Tax=Streptomyces sp. NPDC007084 TaxID=3154313 RepID=UPI00345414C5